jgi:hypothetical protein
MRGFGCSIATSSGIKRAVWRWDLRSRSRMALDGALQLPQTSILVLNRGDLKEMSIVYISMTISTRIMIAWGECAKVRISLELYAIYS